MTPYAGLIEVDGVLYGTTHQGGANSLGTVFSFDPATGTETVLHSFRGDDGVSPETSLTNIGGTLYGTTSAKDPAFGACKGSDCGVVFAVDLATQRFRIAHTFAGGRDGRRPLQLLAVGGLLYGTTMYGGDGNRGTVFRLDPSTGTKTVLYRFAGGRDGQYPHTGLVAIGDTLYGTTFGGGDQPILDGCCGTVFAVSLATGEKRVLHRFLGHGDGMTPEAALIPVGNTLYGAAYSSSTGGSDGGSGVLFAVDATSGAERILHHFNGAGDGWDPKSSLTLADGALYGTTSGSGAHGRGTVYAITPSTEEFSLLYTFDLGDGAYPGAPLLNVGGRLYGTTQIGGDPVCHCGVIYKLMP